MFAPTMMIVKIVVCAEAVKMRSNCLIYALAKRITQPKSKIEMELIPINEFISVPRFSHVTWGGERTRFEPDAPKTSWAVLIHKLWYTGHIKHDTNTKRRVLWRF